MGDILTMKKYRLRITDLPVFILAALLLYWLSSCSDTMQGTDSLDGGPDRTVSTAEEGA